MDLLGRLSRDDHWFSLLKVFPVVVDLLWIGQCLIRYQGRSSPERSARPCEGMFLELVRMTSEPPF